ncbi:hypothetical protein EGR_05881 [Echinococcus granulosus]|uniref:Uncharacterized protein n=1 Tax=Echinococcus granulosus TaxID=6210 RepID=W6UD80_ECHGR|nr:hypothetical protein EGR_05881 [Echinococcus granulosus]EUB59280.1 hypothetical protein EGR_05881 [Echinococcus granulosus]
MKFYRQWRGASNFILGDAERESRLVTHIEYLPPYDALASWSDSSSKLKPLFQPGVSSAFCYRVHHLLQMRNRELYEKIDPEPLQSDQSEFTKWKKMSNYVIVRNKCSMIIYFIKGINRKCPENSSVFDRTSISILTSQSSDDLHLRWDCSDRIQEKITKFKYALIEACRNNTCLDKSNRNLQSLVFTKLNYLSLEGIRRLEKKDEVSHHYLLYKNSVNGK